jgi:hypothetical protein
MKELKEQLDISSASGFVRIINASTKELIFEGHNDIQPFAKETVAHLLAGVDDYKPDTVSVHTTGPNLLESEPITKTELTGDMEVEYTTLIRGFTWGGALQPITEIRLLSAAHGIFSKVTGLNIVKGVESILITWTITIN